MSRVIIGLEDVVPFSTYQKIRGAYVSITRKFGNRKLFKSFADKISVHTSSGHTLLLILHNFLEKLLLYPGMWMKTIFTSQDS